MTKAILSTGAILLLALVQLSCKNGVTNNYYGTGASAGNTPHVVVSDTPTAVISYADLASMPRGTIMKLRVNRQGFEVWEVNVVFDGLYSVGADRLILCHTEGGFDVGAGDSGSPLLTSDGRVAGVLCYGYSGNSTDFAARAIGDVLSVDSGGVATPYGSSMFTEIKPVYYTAGLDDVAASRYPKLAGVLENNPMQVGGRVDEPSPLAKTSDNQTIPGSSIAVMYISGDYYYEYAVGTISYVSKENIFAFGHSYDTFLAAPTYLAGTSSFINSTLESFKMAAPSAQLVGSFVQNDFDGVLIKTDVQPLVARLNTTCSINGQQQFSYKHQISNTPYFSYDEDLAAQLSSSLVYNKLTSLNLEGDSLTASCTANIVTDQDSTDTSFVLYGNEMDLRIYYYLQDSLQVSLKSKELKQYNLDVKLNH